MRKTINAQRAIELRDDLTWQQIADVLSYEDDRYPPYKSRSVESAVKSFTLLLMRSYAYGAALAILFT